MLYVYAIALDLGPVADLTGVEGEPLLLVPLDAITVIAGEVSERPPLDQITLRAQDTLVRALHERARALLPMRFGTSSANLEELRSTLNAQTTLQERLAAVAGCEQMIVRVIGTTAVPPHESTPVTSGTEYLLSRAQRQRPPPELQRIAAAAGSLARDVRIEPADQPGLLGSIYHLIERGQSEPYRRAVEEGARTVEGTRVIVTGPSPPYAFA